MKKNNVGVIGLGVGERHIESYLKFGCNIKKIFDFNSKKMKLIKKKFPSVEICQSENEIFKDPEINIVSIASYDNYHYEQILRTEVAKTADTPKILERTVVVDASTYNDLASDSRRSISQYDFEVIENEKKRNIVLIEDIYAKQILDESRRLYS